jgi:type II secretory pathway component GspD/PulD (secretin)
MTHHAMKSLITFLSGAAVALICAWLASGGAGRLSNPRQHTFSSFDPPQGPAAAMRFDTGMLKLAEADLEQVLNLYQEVSARTVIRGADLPPVKISLHNQTPLTRVGALQLLDTALAQNGITMVLAGDEAVKAVANRDAGLETPPTFDARAEDLPDSSSYMTCTVRLKNAQPDQTVKMLSMAARMPNSVVYVPSGNLLILRDYAANIRHMLELLQQEDRKLLPWEAGRSAGTNTGGGRL